VFVLVPSSLAVKFARSIWLMLVSKWTDASVTDIGTHLICKAPVWLGVIAIHVQQKWEITSQV
jgi:hypothetical protein